MVRMRIELTTFGRHQFEPKHDVTTRRDPPLSFFGEICVDSQRVACAQMSPISFVARGKGTSA